MKVLLPSQLNMTVPSYLNLMVVLHLHNNSGGGFTLIIKMTPCVLGAEGEEEGDDQGNEGTKDEGQDEGTSKNSSYFCLQGSKWA